MQMGYQVFGRPLFGRASVGSFGVTEAADERLFFLITTPQQVKQFLFHIHLEPSLSRNIAR
jgi:hypothetical protein